MPQSSPEKHDHPIIHIPIIHAIPTGSITSFVSSLASCPSQNCGMMARVQSNPLFSGVASHAYALQRALTIIINTAIPWLNRAIIAFNNRYCPEETLPPHISFFRLWKRFIVVFCRKLGLNITLRLKFAAPKTAFLHTVGLEWVESRHQDKIARVSSSIVYYSIITHAED